MKKFVVPAISGLAALLTVAAVIGCGGGGGGTSGPPPPPPPLIRAEASLLGTPNTPIDPLNIQAGETAQFEVVSYDSNGVRTVLASTGWTTTDNGNTAGVLQSDGTFSATTPTGATKFTATGMVGANSYGESYRVKPIQALVTGVIRDSNGLPVYHAAIVFYNSSNVEVSRAVSQFDGTFRASTSTSAVVFNIDPTSTQKALYYKSFKYQTLRYTELDLTCSVSLPALTNGTTTALGTITLDATMTGDNLNPPPPPPDGCGV